MSVKLAKRGSKTILEVNGRPFIALAGEVHNSDSSSPAYMEGIWDIADRLGMNAVILPVTWEMIEPIEGTFDLSIPEALIRQAREWKKKIILLWFGSWKNADGMSGGASGNKLGTSASISIMDMMFFSDGYGDMKITVKAES